MNGQPPGARGVQSAVFRCGLTLRLSPRGFLWMKASLEWAIFGTLDSWMFTVVSHLGTVK